MLVAYMFKRWLPFLRLNVLKCKGFMLLLWFRARASGTVMTRDAVFAFVPNPSRTFRRHDICSGKPPKQSENSFTSELPRLLTVNTLGSAAGRKKGDIRYWGECLRQTLTFP
jgi:hypothetical protein